MFTRDLERGERIAREHFEAGCCFLNAFVRSDPRLSFGGVNLSGYGRELGLFGIREFTDAKSVCVAGIRLSAFSERGLQSAASST